MEKKTKQQLQEFLNQGKCSVTMLVGDQLEMGSVYFSSTLQINQFFFTDGDGGQNTSDGLFLRNVSSENEENRLGEIILILNNLQLLHREEKILVYAYIALVANIENVDLYPFVVFERN